MQPVHYFQRYSQPENVATNNTLLLFSRLYYHSPAKYNLLLSDMFSGTEIQPGIVFKQQEKGKASVPDGLIAQNSFQIVIETKLYDNFSIEQLINHCKKFVISNVQILLSLSPGIIKTDEIEEHIKEFNKKNGTNITHCHITFKKIIEHFRDIVDSHDLDFVNIIDDFEDYCYSAGLIDLSDGRMRGVNCGQTLEENFKYNLYYDPSDRGYSKHSYIGIYSNKCIHGIGKIENIITAELTSDELNVLESTELVSEDQKNRIIGAIRDAYEKREWEIESGHKFFMVEKFFCTTYIKESFLPMRGTQFFDLYEILNMETLPDIEMIADKLKECKW